MPRNLATLGPDVIEVPLWRRKIGWQELAAVIRAREQRTVPLAANPGLEQAIGKVLAQDPVGGEASERLSQVAGQQRLEVLEILNAKLSHILERAHPGLPAVLPTPMRLLESGEG
ncbi:MAG: hypothetical protein HQM02_09705, partial [Magnetococcales bacterium]|nr:hypothetical protein [Magnetococcales bacterium]